MTTPFALWLTGLPGSGKSTVTQALVKLLRSRSIDPAVLESDTFRKYFSPHATYEEDDRERFYQGMVEVARMFLEKEIPVILDATGNRRAYRDPARKLLPAFAEIYVDCPLETCIERDPKGLYQKARAGQATHVPGLQAEYEPPLHPEVHLRSDREDPESAARKVLDFLIQAEWIPYRRAYRV